MKFKFFAVVVFLIIYSGIANAAIITMESGDRYVNHGFGFGHGVRDNLAASSYPNSGYSKVLTSGFYVAFQHIDNVGISLLNQGTWDFNGAFFASAWDASNDITLKGFNNGNLLYSTTISITNASKMWIQSDFTGITVLTISGSGNQITWDDFTYNEVIANVSVPSTIAIFALGIMGLASRRFTKQS